MNIPNLFTFHSNLSHGPIDNRYGTVEEVKTNREKIFQKINHSQDNVIKINAANSTDILIAMENNRESWQHYLGVWTNGDGPIVDAIITDVPGIVLECDPGDCGVYTLFHPDHHLLAMVHSGRQGSVEKILEKVIVKMAALVNAQTSDFCAGLKIEMAPAIKGKRYVLDYIVLERGEVNSWLDYLGDGTLRLIDYPYSNKVKLVFDEHHDKIFFNFIGFNKNLLLNLGCKEENMNISNICTFDNENYPSYFKYLKGLANDGRFMVLSSFQKR